MCIVQPLTAVPANEICWLSRLVLGLSLSILPSPATDMVVFVVYETPALRSSVEAFLPSSPQQTL